MKKLFILLITTVCYSATNDTTIDSAIIKRIYMGNYNYNTILASAPILTMRWASDLNRPVFKNRTGTAYKMLADASTTSNTPSTRIFYADANGAAGSSANLVFDGSKLNITGKLTTSDSITCGNIKSSGRITGTDIDVSDSVKAVSGAFTGNLRSPLLLSDSIATKTIYSLANAAQFAGIFRGSPITNQSFGVSIRAGTSIYDYALTLVDETSSYYQMVVCGNGYTGILTGNPQYPLDVSGEGRFTSGVNATDFRASDSVKAVSGAFTGRITGSDIAVTDSIKGTSAHLTGRLVSENLKANDSVIGTRGNFSSVYSRYMIAVDSGGIFTGPAELNHSWYLGGHAVAYNNGPNQFRIDGPRAGAAFRIDSSAIDSTLVIANDTVKTKKLVASGGNVVTYSQGTLSLNVLGFTISPIAITAKYIKHGNLVTINIDTTISGTSNNSYLYFSTLPDSLRPSKSLFASANTLTISNVESYSPDALALSVQTDGTVYVYRYGATAGGTGWTSVGNKAFQRFCFTYPTN